MSGSRALALAAGLLMGVPHPASGGTILWAGLCDATHPGKLIPIPLNRGGDQEPANACHAACGTVPDRRTRV